MSATDSGEKVPVTERGIHMPGDGNHAPPCSTCGGEGWVTESEHGCDGSEQVCLTTCPIPVQAPCPDCAPPTPITTDLCDGEPF